MTETRITNSTTGGQKGQKMERMELLPMAELLRVSRIYGYGAEKYEARNWEKGYDWSLSIGAMLRHATQFAGGEDIDSESGEPHLSSVVFHALALLQYMRTHPELDDRSGKKPRVPDSWITFDQHHIPEPVWATNSKERL